MNVFLKRYKEWGHVFEPDHETRKCIRVNTFNIDEAKLIARLKKNNVKLEKVGFLDHAYYASADFALSSTPEYLQGHYYIQEAASQLAVKVLDVKPGLKVLDMAAAPGSKTTQIAACMENKGVIVALDVRNERLQALANNLQRMGVSNTILYNKDARYVADLGLEFDMVLLDAPCSGNYVIENDWFSKRSLEDFKDMAKLQKQLLKAAVSVLKKGGSLVYSTCSLEKEEDEEVVQWALDNLPVKLVKLDGKFSNDALPGTLKLWPYLSGTQGFFVAKLLKTS